MLYWCVSSLVTMAGYKTSKKKWPGEQAFLYKHHSDWEQKSSSEGGLYYAGTSQDRVRDIKPVSRGTANQMGTLGNWNVW